MRDFEIPPKRERNVAHLLHCFSEQSWIERGNHLPLLWWGSSNHFELGIIVEKHKVEVGLEDLPLSLSLSKYT